MPCAFCDIASGANSALVVFGDDNVMAFLDHRPLFPGHLLVAPKSHHQTIGDLPPTLIAPLFETVRRLTVAVETAMDAQGTFVALNNKVSQSVPHLHVHIVPRSKGDGLKGFFWPRHPYRDEQHMRETHQRLVSAIG